MKKNNPTILTEEENFISDSKAAVLNKTTLLANSILYAIATLLVLSIIWSYFAQIDQIVTGSGKIIPASKIKVIQSLDGGIINNIFVSEGEQVIPNQILLKLEDTRYKADYLNGYSKYLALTAMVARLTSEMGAEPEVIFPEHLKKNQPELVAREIKLFETRREAGQKQFNILQNSLELANNEFKMYEKLVNEGVVSMIDYYRSQRRVYDVQEKILRLQASFRESVLTELNQKKAELASLTEQLAGLRNKIDYTTIRSPILGIVKKMQITTVGGVISPGMDIMEIVPLADTLLVEARIGPNDIELITTGQSAKIRLAAYDYSIYGSLSGTVEYVSADTVEDPQRIFNKADGANSNMPLYYVVKIRIDPNALSSKNNLTRLIPGMIANVQIITGKKSILEYLLKPLMRIREEAFKE